MLISSYKNLNILIDQPESSLPINLKDQTDKPIFFDVKGFVSKILILTFFIVPFTLSSQQTIDIGLIEDNKMEAFYNLIWFSKKYNGFTPTVSLNGNLAENLRQSEFFVFMGTWCHDTKMFLPKFFKLLDSMNISKDQITLYNVDKKKRRPRAPIKNYGIKYLPTIIFIKDGMEIGRIVEFPFFSMEEDISKMYANLKEDTKD